MPRPCKRRRICAEPSCVLFGPMKQEDGADTEGGKYIPEPDNAGGRAAKGRITMALDEYESIRLIDLEGLTQEQCAQQMGVARTTAQAIYASARAKLAECLVNGKNLAIAGGEYVVCGGDSQEQMGFCGCPGGWCRRKNRRIIGGSNQEEKTMKLAVTYENGQVFQHFGHTEQFKVYEVENGAVVSAEVVDTNGSGHGALAGFLRALGVEALICGGIGGGARNALAEAGIQLYPGASGDADAQVAALLGGTLDYNPDTMCNHHGEGHTCGSHGEGHEGHCGGHGEGHEGQCGGHEGHCGHH